LIFGINMLLEIPGICSRIADVFSTVEIQGITSDLEAKRSLKRSARERVVNAGSL
jgi:hypothetical protein